MAIYNDVRPQFMAEVQGQPAVTKILSAQMKTRSFAGAYLFTGTRGTGKTSTARILAKAINCLNPDAETGEPCNECANCRAITKGISRDVKELDAARNRSVEDARSLVEQTQYPPVEGAKRIFIIDEVHMFTNEAFNTMLKTLEEPPAWCTFILCTTEEYKVPPTIISRCQKFAFSMVDEETIQTLLDNVLLGLGEKADFDALMLIAKAARGSIRDALSILDKCREGAGSTITAAYVREVQGMPDESRVFALLKAVSDKDSDSALACLEGLSESGIGAVHIIRIAQEILSDVLRIRAGVRVANYSDYVEQVRALADSVSETMALSLIRLFLQAKETIRGDLMPDISLQGEVIGWLAREKEEERLKALIEENAKIAETAKHMIAQMEQMAAGARFAPTEKKQEIVSSSPVRDAAEWHSDGGKTPFDGPEGAEASPEPVPAVPADDSTGSGDDMDAFMAFMANDGQDGDEDQGGEDNSADEYEEDDEDDYSLVMF